MAVDPHAKPLADDPGLDLLLSVPLGGPPIDWDARQGAVIAGLAPLGFLLGEWVGRGEAHGTAVSGRLRVQAILGGTFIEASEQLTEADGRLNHEDRAFYRFDDEEAALRVTHLMAPGWLGERLVRPLEPAGVVWTAGPFAPRVELRPTAAGGLRVEVWMAFASAPEAWMDYQRP